MTNMVAIKKVHSDQCHRCGGLMVPEKVFEIGSIDWHCISCGERVDRVILAHRQRDPAKVGDGKVCTGKGHAQLNEPPGFYHAQME